MFSAVTNFWRVAVLLLLPAFIAACSEPIGGLKDPTISEYAFRADILLVGNVKVRHPKVIIGGDANDAEVEVDCVFKGEVSDAVLNITNMGAIPGMCIETTVEVGKDYIFALSEMDGTFRLWHDKIEKTEENMNKLLKQCGLISMRPNDTPGTGKLACPTVADPDNCEKYVPPSPPTDVGPPAVKPDDAVPSLDVPPAKGEPTKVGPIPPAGKGKTEAVSDASGASSISLYLMSQIVTVLAMVILR